MDGNSEIETAFERYVALTGDEGASPDDPAVRRFCEAYAAAFEHAAAEKAAARARRCRPFGDEPAG